MSARLDRLAGDHSELALEAAARNYRKVKDKWCECGNHDDIVYYRSPVTGSHGWMCAKCLCIVQTG
jgi:hypothetical protein